MPVSPRMPELASVTETRCWLHVSSVPLSSDATPLCDQAAAAAAAAATTALPLRKHFTAPALPLCEQRFL